MKFINGLVHGFVFMIIGILGNEQTNGEYTPGWSILCMSLVLISILYFSIMDLNIVREESSK